MVLEKTIVKTIMDYLRSIDALVFKVHGSQYQMPGISDILCCLNGTFVAIEVKVPGKLNNVTEAQSNFIKRVNDAGGIGMIVSDLTQVQFNLAQSLFGDRACKRK